jgi:uncharacterized protein
MSNPQSSHPGPWPNRFVWHDLMTTDAKKSQAFYTALFDWQIQEVPMPGPGGQTFIYRMVMCGPGPIGGIVEEKNIPMSHWMPYVAVDDVDKAAKKVAELGGTVCVPPTDIPATGRFAVIGDPCGAYLSIYQGLPESQGADPDQAIPGRICWNETYTTDPDKAQAFYGKLFGWKPDTKQVAPGVHYSVQMCGDKQAGGLMKHPMPGLPSCWVVYFFVEDLAKATAKAKQLGATAMMEGVPIPGVGQFSMVTDPCGAMFALFQANEGLGQC